jgi:hypothetical protein
MNWLLVIYEDAFMYVRGWIKALLEKSLIGFAMQNAVSLE